MKAWHFVGETLRGGAPVPPDGEKLIHTGALKFCKSGLHASKDVLDALKYAPGPTLCRVRLSGLILVSEDKFVASERTIIWRRCVEAELRVFARWCGLSVARFWVMSPVVRQYLESGAEDLRALVRKATWAKELNVARSAAWAAAGEVPWDAAWGAARSAAWAAAGEVPWDVAWGEAWDKAHSAQARKLEAFLGI
ncbi:MAG: DUF7666 domain-containing protein [Nitrososphaera sp.]